RFCLIKPRERATQSLHNRILDEPNHQDAADGIGLGAGAFHVGRSKLAGQVGRRNQSDHPGSDAEETSQAPSSLPPSSSSSSPPPCASSPSSFVCELKDDALTSPPHRRVGSPGVPDVVTGGAGVAPKDSRVGGTCPVWTEQVFPASL